jgi:hypothetical protein
VCLIIYFLNVDHDLTLIQSFTLSIFQSFNLSIFQTIKISNYQNIKLSIFQTFNLSLFRSFTLSIFQTINLSRHMTAMRARAMREADTRKNSVRALEVSRHNRAQVSGVLDVGWTLVGRWLDVDSTLIRR